MTRINVIDVQLLTDQHLMAEYRELPMVNSSLNRSRKSKKGINFSKISDHYTLNTGHVYFFYNKGKFLFKRYEDLIKELKNRKYNIIPDERKVDWNVFSDYNGQSLWNDWSPSLVDISVNIERITEKIESKPEFYRYHSDKINKNKYLKEILGV